MIDFNASCFKQRVPCGLTSPGQNIIDAAGLLGIGLIVAGVVVLRLFSEASVDA